MKSFSELKFDCKSVQIFIRVLRYRTFKRLNYLIKIDQKFINISNFFDMQNSLMDNFHSFYILANQQIFLRSPIQNIHL